MRISDWSSDVCSSDLNNHDQGGVIGRITWTAAGSDAPSRGDAHLCQKACAQRQFEKSGLSRRRLFSPQHRSEEHTSELQSLMRISYAVICLNKKIII